MKLRIKPASWKDYHYPNGLMSFVTEKLIEDGWYVDTDEELSYLFNEGGDAKTKLCALTPNTPNCKKLMNNLISGGEVMVGAYYVFYDRDDGRRCGFHPHVCSANVGTLVTREESEILYGFKFEYLDIDSFFAQSKLLLKRIIKLSDLAVRDESNYNGEEW